MGVGGGGGVGGLTPPRISFLSTGEENNEL